MIYFRNGMRISNHLKYRSHVNRLNFMMAGPRVSPVRSHVLDYEYKLTRGGVMLLLYVRTWLHVPVSRLGVVPSFRPSQLASWRFPFVRVFWIMREDIIGGVMPIVGFFGTSAA